MKTPAQAATNYATNAGSAAAATSWAADYLTQFPTMVARATAQVSYWQSQVSTQQAATDYVDGLNRAQSNIAAITTKVNGAGKTSYSAGVKNAGAAGGNYSNFAAEWLPAVATEVATLNRTNPRGDYAQNQARLAAFIDWEHAQKGNYKQ